MNFIERNTKKVALIVCVATAASGVTTVLAAQSSDGWHGAGEERIYVADGITKMNTLVFDTEGTYYVDNEGHPITSGWKTINGQTYYFDKDGKKVTGTQVIEGKRYYFQKNGILPIGWSNDNLSYFNEYGEKLTGIQSIEGITYNFGTAGNLEQGWLNIDGREVYFVNGTLASGQVAIDGQNYNFAADGTITKGWQQVGNEKVYYDEFGNMKHGWTDIDGNRFYFTKEGFAVTDTEYAGFDFDKDGIATEHKETPVSKASNGKAGSTTTAAANLPGANGSIASAALAQVGVYQDCTALASNALAAVGIYFHGWPADYMSLGTITSSPQAGDLIYYANGGAGPAHIAVYIGNGQAVHGGWLGNQTVVQSAYVGSGPVFIRVTR